MKRILILGLFLFALVPNVAAPPVETGSITIQFFVDHGERSAYLLYFGDNLGHFSTDFSEPFTLSWDPSDAPTSITFNGLNAGTYHINWDDKTSDWVDAIPDEIVVVAGQNSEVALWASYIGNWPIEPPSFKVPELPLGSFTALLTMVFALVLRRRK